MKERERGIISKKTYLADLCSVTTLKKKITKMALALALLLSVLLIPAQTGKAASGSYKLYNFVVMGSTSELITKNYSVFQISGGFRLVKNGKTIKTVKNVRETVRGTVLYGDNDFYYTAYAGKPENYTCTVYRMTAAGKASKIGTVSKVPYLFELDAVYKNKVYGHISRSNAKTTTTIYSIDVKNHKTAKVSSLDGEVGYMRGEDMSPSVSSGKLLFVVSDRAVMVDLATGKKNMAVPNIKGSRGDINTSAWKDKKTTYVEQDDAVQKYNKKTGKFEKDKTLSKYARKYDVIYADENTILYEVNGYYYLYMRSAGKKTRIGKTSAGGAKDIMYIDGPVTKGSNVYFITERINASDIWKASIKTGKAQKIKSSKYELTFRSDGKKIGYNKYDSNLTIKYVYTLK